MPSGRVIVLKIPLSTPGATVQLAGTTTGGQASAHVPSQLLWVGVSLVKP